MSIVLYAISMFLAKNKFFKSIRITDVCLILISLCFYGWAEIVGIPFIFTYILFIYIAGKLINYLKNSVGKKLLLGFSITVLVLVLIYFRRSTIISMLGISFITFSAISYLMDIYRRDAEPKGFIDVMLYIVFFPKVISGPIVLWKDFEPQIQRAKPSLDQFAYGLNRIMIGFAKKLLIADFFGSTIDLIQTNQMSTGIDIPTAWLCTIFYTIQIYYDFSGYSDVAIGLSKLIGIDIKENFNFPYLSKSITEFWRRWHISLGTWFREYLYIPLGGNRKGKGRTLINLAIVFVVTGIWHGTGPRYILWGMLHGICMILERIFKDNKVYLKIPKAFKWLATMFVVNIGWELFRLESLGKFIEFFKIMIGKITFEDPFFTWQYFMSTKVIIMMVIAILGATLLGKPKAQRWLNNINEGKAGQTILFIKQAALLLIMAFSIVTMVSSSYSPYIYFQY
jgi:alginate O-acetyltransferase complex protein AlgI